MTASTTTSNSDLLSSSLLGNYLSSMSQFTKWTFTQEQLEACRRIANSKARQALSVDKSKTLPVESFACRDKQTLMDTDNGPMQDAEGNEFLTWSEESMLVSFYASKLLGLVGPMAQVPKLRRESKVVATAALLYQRFFLSNSVLMFDPKSIMVAAAFLATKVEDCMADVRHLQEGTTLMKATVTPQSIIANELSLLTGIDFDLTCIHPYKAVLAFTEDLRTFLKSKQGRQLAVFEEFPDRITSGQDLKPIHDDARRLMDDVIVSHLPLLYSPGQVALAALMVSNGNLLKGDNAQHTPKIDFRGYLQHLSQQSQHSYNLDELETKLETLCTMLMELKDGLHGCGNHKIDLAQLKLINKKLKMCKAWGEKKKKKRKNESEEERNAPSKKIKTEA